MQRPDGSSEGAQTWHAAMVQWSATDGTVTSGAEPNGDRRSPVDAPVHFLIEHIGKSLTSLRRRRRHQTVGALQACAPACRRPNCQVWRFYLLWICSNLENGVPLSFNGTERKHAFFACSVQTAAPRALKLDVQPWCNGPQRMVPLLPVPSQTATGAHRLTPQCISI